MANGVDESALAFTKRLLRENPVRLRESGVEAVPGVAGVDLSPLPAQFAHHHIIGADKLDDQLIRQRSQPVDHVVKRDRIAEDEVVQHGQSENRIGTTPLGQRGPFPIPPAEAPRRVGEVDNRGDNRAVPFGRELLVKAFDAGRI